LTNATVRIDGLPLDNKEYVIVNYKGVLKNYGLSTDIPIVAIELGLVQGSKLIKDELTCIVGLPELSTIRIGTIWKNQIRQDGYWSKYDRYIEKLPLTFDLEKIPAKISRYKRENHILHRIDFEEQDVLEDKNQDDYYGSTFTEFGSEDGIKYIVPSMELLISTYLPRNKLIRNELLLHSIDTIIANYVVEHKNTGTKYEITIDKPYEEETIIFLAYLACNKKTRTNLSKVLTSVSLGNHSKLKHLVALPYHPSKISFKASGIWLNEKVFYIQRIYEPKVPNEIPIKLIRKKSALVPNDVNHVTRTGPMENGVPLNNAIIDKETKVSHKKNPNATVGMKYIVSEVSPDNSDINLEIEEEIENIINGSNSYNQENIEVEDASSGKLKGDAGSKKTARTKYIVEKNPEIISHSEEIISALLELTEGSIPRIQDLKYIDDNAHEHDELVYTSFCARHINMNDNKYWASGYVRSSGIKKAKSGYRKLLIVKITIEGVKPIYLLEIVRKVKSDSFFGVIFQLPIDLDFDVLEDIKDVIASNKGHFVGKNILQFPIKKAVRMKHKWGLMKQRFENVFDIIKEKKIFD